MDQRLPIDQKASLLMLVLCSIWAMQQVLLKATTPDFSPTLQLALRSGIGGALVMLFVLFRGQRFDRNNGTLLPGLAAGFLFSFEFFLVSISVQLTTTHQAKRRPRGRRLSKRKRLGPTSQIGRAHV